MKTISHKITLLLLLTQVILFSCRQEVAEEERHDEETEGEAVSFTARQFDLLGIAVGAIPTRNLSAPIQVSGILEVPPQHEAVVTTIVGAHISGIQVIEGDPVNKGQLLAYLTHPDIIRLQSDYLETYNRFQMAEQEFNRQSRLYEEEVGAGRAFQQTQTEYRTLQGLVKSHEAQLRLLGLQPQQVQQGNFSERVALHSPISGSVVDVSVKNGQYVQPETELFELINPEHIHLKLLVYERDIAGVQVGQEVRFRLNTGNGGEMTGQVFSVSQKFEPQSKAIQVHAEMDRDYPGLIPGMYVQAEILTGETEGLALPDAAVVRDGDGHLAFELTETGDREGRWTFLPRAVKVTKAQNGWVGVQFLEEVSLSASFALNQAYQIHAELKKGEVDVDH